MTGPDTQDVFVLGSLYHTPISVPVEVTVRKEDSWFTSTGLFSNAASSARAVNRSGQVVGKAVNYVNGLGMVERAFITGPNGVGMRDLGIPAGVPGAIYISGTDVNDSGQVIGEVQGYSWYISGFITGPNGVGMRRLGNDGEFLRPASTNDRGQVAGYLRNEFGAPRAFITGPDGHGVTVLGTLGGGSTPASVWSDATGINSSGQIVGNSSVQGNDMQAFVTGDNGLGMVALGTLGGGLSAASAINDLGQVVGWSYVDFKNSPTSHAFIYNLGDGRMMDLNTLVSIGDGQFLENAVAINNSGQILAVGGGSNWLLTPIAVPEPAEWTVMAAALVLAFAIHRRTERRRGQHL